MISYCIFITKNRIFIITYLLFVHKFRINCMFALVQVMACHRTGICPLPQTILNYCACVIGSWRVITLRPRQSERHLQTAFIIESITTTYMENVSTEVLDKIKNTI